LSWFVSFALSDASSHVGVRIFVLHCHQ
jgi:hypothetical protein